MDYDVEIKKTVRMKGSDGTIEFGVAVDMVQSILNRAEEDKKYHQFHMDLFEDIRVIRAQLNGDPMPASRSKEQLDAEKRQFKYGAYVFNDNETLKTGLPMKEPKVEEESDIINALLSYVQNFKGEHRKVGDKWQYSRKLGDYELVYELEFTDVVYYNDMLCAKINGTATCANATKEVVMKPMDYTLWLALEENVVAASRIEQEYRVKQGDQWVSVTMELKKELTRKFEADASVLQALKQNHEKLLETERALRQRNPDTSKYPEQRAFLQGLLQQLGDNQYARGVQFIYEQTK
ncbi:MAG: hypothetical protein U5N86_04795 [Planctomycetota bacterium]|nr:hypothetical protein [Planctomycetota bacterium]